MNEAKILEYLADRDEITRETLGLAICKYHDSDTIYGFRLKLIG